MTVLYSGLFLTRGAHIIAHTFKPLQRTCAHTENKWHVNLLGTRPCVYRDLNAP